MVNWGYYLDSHQRVVFCGLLLLATAALGQGVAACGRAGAGSGDLEVGLRLLTEKAVGPASVEVTLRMPDGRPVEGADVRVRGDMTHAGMVPVLVGSKETVAGRYLTEDFRFSMVGDWVLTVEATLSGGERVERAFSVPGVGAR